MPPIRPPIEDIPKPKFLKDKDYALHKIINHVITLEFQKNVVNHVTRKLKKSHIHESIYKKRPSLIRHSYIAVSARDH